MRIVRASRFHLKAISVVWATLILPIVTLDTAAQSSENWWNLNSERDLAEKGKLKELLTKKKVYVTVTFSDVRPNSPLNNAEQTNVSRAVNEAIAAHRDLQKVT